MNCGVRQTDKHFDMEQLLEVKPPQREASGKVPLDQLTRHRLWLRKKVPTGKRATTYRPIKFYRRATKNLLRHIDNQFRHSTPVGGLKFFLPDYEDGKWREEAWATWPFILMALDQGSDNLSAVHALERHYGLNLDAIFDFAHGANRDTQTALGTAHLKAFWQCMCVSFNMPHGPNQDKIWADTLCEVTDHLRQNHQPQNTPLYLAEVPDIIEQLRAAGVDLNPDLDPEQAVWEFIFEEAFRKYGNRVTSARFQGSIAAAQKSIEFWSIDKFIRTASCSNKK